MINEKMKEYGLQGSTIRELSEYGRKRKKEIGNDNVFDFSIGNPNVECPEIVTKSLLDIISNTDPVLLHGYSSAAGMESCRIAIANYLNITYGTNESADYIYLTAGAAAALTISINALLNENEEVIVFAPFFPEYKVYVENAGGKLILCNCDTKTFLPDLNDLENKITHKTKIIIINSPNNPTGVIYDEKTIIAISNILKKKQNEFNHEIYLLSDEPYRELIYTNIKYPFITNYYENSIVTYSFSKSLSLPGERIGYILVGSNCQNKNEVFTAILGSGRALGFICESTLFQYLIPYCLGHTSNFDIYKKNRNLLSNHLIKLGYEVVQPDGAFYLFVKALEKDANKFSEVAKKFELLLVPSDSFGCEGYVRVSYCVSTKQILDSFPAFEKLINYYKESRGE